MVYRQPESGQGGPGQGWPPPQPQQPRQKRSVLSEVPVALLGAGITALATVVAALVGHATNTLNVVVGAAPTVVQTITVAPPGGSVPSGTSDGPQGPQSPGLPDGVSQRRSTGSTAITLRPSYGVDLDDNLSPNWSVKSGPLGSSAGYGSDVGSDAYESKLDFLSDYAIVDAAEGYATCAEETGYTRGGIPRGDLREGEEMCLRTTEGRYALVKVVSATAGEIRITATVWDPPTN
jgi:hypothetical protein